jgi:hypothetical protein
MQSRAKKSDPEFKNWLILTNCLTVWLAFVCKIVMQWLPIGVSRKAVPAEEGLG